MSRITSDDLQILLERALGTRGFGPAHATALARQTVLSEEMGQASVGVSHVFDYLDGIAGGRINGHANPEISRPVPTMIHVDGDGGLPQTGFDLAFDTFTASAHDLGLCVFLQKNTTLCGSLGTFARRVAEAGLVVFAATNGSALLAGSGGSKPVFCTNPMAFAAPQSGGPPLLIDQSSSATAYVNIRKAAERGDAIPEGWALDADGQPTTDPKAAVSGTLLAFGGARGANIALMVDVLAGGLTGANWSVEAPGFMDGNACPGTGLFVLAINPVLVTPDFNDRMAVQIARLSGDYGVHIPGLSKEQAQRDARENGLDIDAGMLDRLRAIAG